ncbi:class I SAM-dependent methyltransferase [Antarcticibacterium sp. 1MA-6-2]|uniref:class I SAM-dependent methyltransferase n=1 Tax=Antarcticibacterium sp. 1MA-6-2 TaxID=2908210 RepID=UPI001F16F2C9|nr:class I SAM-dependent methyltransferase [Antarcticibacterium sp. 1MA-6-2]UJH92596.1 class I SAM-dependent methyltransferase [Antarcticibacterium sp. 1MA-6-2]
MSDQKINKGHSENYFGDYRDFWWNKDFVDLTAQRLELNKLGSVLDVGCGNGHWTRILAPYLQKEASVTAVDSDPRWFSENAELQNFFSATGNPFQLKKGDAQNLPFPDAQFDLVTCQTVLIHVPEPQKALKEMKRVLKPGGTLLCVEPNNIVQSLIKTSISKNESVEESLDHIKYKLIIEKGKKKLGKGDNSLGDLLPGMFAMEDLKNVEVRLSDKAIAMYPPYDNEEQLATLKQWMKGSSWNSTTQKDIDFFSAAGEAYMQFYFEYQEKYANRDAHIMGALQREQYHAAGGSLMYLVSGIK